jgi:hypothetical protein
MKKGKIDKTQAKRKKIKNHLILWRSGGAWTQWCLLSSINGEVSPRFTDGDEGLI